jgi:hypothetical protein
VGRLHDVLEAISETQNTLQATGERWVEAELNRIAGEVALMFLKRIPQEPKSISIARSMHVSSKPVLGTARRNEHGGALARPEQAG